MQLNVKTRGDSRAKGKPKLYIACYNSNKALAVECISEWIFKVRNYAIYYPEGNSDCENADHEEDLMQMNCIIIPVYPKILEEDEGALRDYRFAVNNNIPVFTILMEGEDTPEFFSKYQNIYGNIQLLTPYSRDQTKIPFEQILIQYLERKISDDVEGYQKYQQEGYFAREINQSIREEFRGSVFISYRKKNRNHVNELIQKLHNEQELMDIMLWYDEYLIPGEIYSDILKESIVTCDVVLLLITPDILEKNNYVLLYEYPLACAANKPVVAVEIEKVDENILGNRFPALNFYLKKEDYDQVPEFLAQLFRKIKGNQNPIRGKRAFMLGKAYMDGKLVEINRRRGIKLIEKAAEDKFVPALRTIINIYMEGNGVEIDPKIQLMWEKKLESVLEQERSLKLGAAAANRKEIIDVYEKEGDNYLKSVRFQEAVEAYKNMLLAASELCEFNSDTILGSLFAAYEVMACNKIANASMYTGNYRQAREYLELAVKKNKESYRENISLGGNNAIAETWKIFGRLENAENNKKRAIECYKQALQYIESTPDISSLSEVNEWNRCEIYGMRGWIYFDLKEMQNALDDFEQSLKIAEKFDAEYLNCDSKLCVMRANYAIGHLFKECDQPKEAVEFLKMAVSCAEEVVKRENTVSADYDVFKYSVEAASCFYSLKLYFDACVYLKKAEVLLEKKGTKIATIENIEILYTLYGNVLYIQNKPAAARMYYRKLLKYSKISYEKEKDIRSLANLGTAYYKLSTAHLYITDWISIDNAYNIYQLLSQEVYRQRKFDVNFRKMAEFRLERYTVLKQNHQKIRGWTEHLFRVTHAMEEHGLKFSEEMSMSSRIEADILEMVMRLIVDSSEKLEEVSEVLTQSMGIEVTSEELSGYSFMASIFTNSRPSLATLDIPQSVEVAVELMKYIKESSKDYHESYPFNIRIVMWSVGEWVLDTIDAGGKLREDFVEYFDKIDYFIESNYS